MSRRNRLIDPEEVWKMYWSMGEEGRSLDKVHVNLPVNPRTGKLVTRDAVSKAMWRWACRPENYEIAYKSLRAALMGQGELWTDERFKQELSEKARWALTRAQYKRWYEQSGS